jgi:hypothetical protein
VSPRLFTWAYVPDFESLMRDLGFSSKNGSFKSPEDFNSSLLVFVEGFLRNAVNYFFNKAIGVFCVAARERAPGTIKAPEVF